MKKLSLTFALAAIMTMGTSTAFADSNGGIIISDLNGQAKQCSEESTEPGIIISDFTSPGIIISDLWGSIFGKAECEQNTEPGIIISD